MNFLTKLMQLLKKNFPTVMIVLGCLFLCVPSKIPEVKWLYALGVWIWPFCYLYYGRFCNHRFFQPVLLAFLCIGLNIRFYGVLGQGLEAESAILLIFASCAFWVPFAWDSRYCKNGNSFVYTLVFPVVYGTLNLILSACNIIPICNLAYAQYDNKPLLQVVSVIGEYGLTFLITWVASIGVYVCEKWKRGNGKQVAIIVLAVLAALHIGGAIRMSMADECNSTVRVAQAIGPKLQQLKGAEWEVLPFERNMSSFNSIALSAAERKAQMLVFSEEAFTIMDVNESLFVENAKQKAKEYNMHILLTLEVDDTDESDEGRLFNKMILIDKTGKVIEEYVKHNAVPVVESMYIVVGKGKIPTVPLDFDGNTYKVSFVICYDGNFSEYIRKMDPTTQLYFNPSWDWDAINDFHYRSIGIRSVENGVNLMMTTYDGWSIVTEPYGHELERNSIEKLGYEKVSVFEMPTCGFTTIYSKIGGSLNLVYPIASLFFIALGQRRRRKLDDDDDDDDDENRSDAILGDDDDDEENDRREFERWKREKRRRKKLQRDSSENIERE